MRKLHYIILTFVACFMLSIRPAQAQTTDGYLTTGDIVSISYKQYPWGGDLPKPKYMSVEGGVITSVEDVTSSCLFQVFIEEVNGFYYYTFKLLDKEQYLKVNNNANGGQEGVLELVNSSSAASGFQISEANNNAERSYLYGRLSSSVMTNWGSITSIYLTTDFRLAGWNPVSLYIEKWEQEGANAPKGRFYPESIILPYAETNQELLDQTVDVTFTIPTQIVISYTCLNQPDLVIGGGQGDVDYNDITDLKFYWESTGNNKEVTSKISHSLYYDDPNDSYELPAEGTAVLSLTTDATNGASTTFTITPVGESPMNLRTNTNSRIQWVNYADRVVAEYEYKGNTVKQTMRVVRNSYHEEPLPPLTFHINPTMFTFGADAETVNITVVPIHQHGSVIYDVNQNVFKTEYEEHTPAYPELLSLTSPTDGWVITTDDGADWLSHTVNTNSIAITAQALGNGQSDRTATFTGTFKRENAGSGHNHQESFTIQLAQRSDAGIQFDKKNQEVHTATRTIYYLPEDRIELRLAESNFFGYMRWYDYHTDKAPNYNFGNDNFGNDYDYATSWYTTPRGANNQPFTPINTPANAETEKDEGSSYGLYAINHHHGGILNEGTENSNNIPVLNGWNYTYNASATTDDEKRLSGYHTIACDVSAYTDYEITTDGGVVKSITEPTLSYRQLFDLRPAGEMADKFAALADGKYLEEYHYQAPAGKNILLTPQFKYRKTNDEYLSKLCYFYWNDENLVRVENATWSGDFISDNGEYITVSGNAGETKTYTLTANGGAVRIAKFTVTFTNPQETGPSRTVLKSDYEIENIYSRKAHIDFNYTDDSKKTTLSDGFTYYNQPLNAAESTYGFVYTQGDLAQTASNTHHGFVRTANQGVFPFYGEYVLVNGVNKSWNEAGISAENHGGKDKGFALYVDGTTEPGLVVSISAPANICSGQTMYCSAWLCNPSNTAHQGSNPIFRFNVQGRKTGQTEWEDAGVFFVGELPKGSGWQQVVFPIESAHSYDETRVSLYNFATSGAANDFLVDDISLFVSQLPIAAYQGKMACRTTANEATNAAAVLRIDYGKINAGADGYIYYQIFNDSYQKSGQNGAPDTIGAPVSLVDNPETAQVDEGYYHDNTTDHDANNQDNHYGSVHLPAANFNPAEKADSLKTAGIDTLASVSKLLDNMVLNNKKHAKAFVRTENNGVVKWLLYVAHIIENITDLDQNKDGQESTEEKQLPLQRLYDKHTYSMRMAYDPDELEVENCNLTTPLHATQQTVFTLRNSNGETIEHINDDGVLTATKETNSENVKYIFDNSKGNCANDLYFLTAKIVNHMAAKGGASIGEVSAPIYADWLVGDENLDAILENTQKSPEEKEAAFAKKYNNYTPGQVTTAIMYDMRRNDPANPNYEAKSFEELDPSAFLSQQNYDIIRHLCDSGWLQFRDTTIHFYLAPDAKASYWCFPIEGTAKTTVKDEKGNEMEVTIKDCNEPRRVVITAASSEHYLNIAPLEQAKKTTPQKLQLPKVNVLQPREGNLTTVTIPVCKNTADQYDQYYEIGSTTDVDGLTDNNITIQLSEATFFDLEKGKPYDTRPTLEVGEEYTLRLQLKDNNGNINISDENSCRIGYVFATIQIVPNTLVWQPTGHSFNGWGKNENWRGWNDVNSDGLIEDGELITGYVPMEGADVVIPDLNNPLLYPYIVPEHDHDHYPMTVHHDQHKCRYIYLAPGAHLNNQHLLDYEKAFVDMPIPKGNWYMMSSPLQDMYSGDMYIPHSGDSFEDDAAANLESTQPFLVKSFQGKRSSQGPYAFWASYYNQAVKTYYDNGIYTETSAVAAEFQSSNSLVQPLPIGSGFMLWGEGPDNMESDTLVVRLPKPDTYYTSSGGNKYYPQSRENVHKFAFTANHEVDTMQITLTNEAGSEYFLFGNPTMAFINMHDFLHDNEAVLNHVFYRIENGTWDAATELTMSNDRFLAPMTSVMLKGKESNTSLTVTLKASHLTLNNQVNPFSEDNPAVSPVAPRRSSNADTQASTSNKQTSEIMTIYAFTQDAQARTVVAANPLAYDYYQVGEDAIFISSGVENQSYVTTPLNMYTVAEQVPMMADVRQGISNIPLAMLIHDDCRTQHMQLAFYLSPNWTRKCYLHDTATGQKMRIMDGLVITVDMPQNHEQRYIIEGPDQYIGSNNNDSTTTSVENNLSANADEATVHAYSVEKGTLTVLSNQLIEQVKVYNLTGQLMLTHRPSLLSYQLSTNAQLPTGICVVEATLHNGATLYTQTIVK